MTTEYRSTNFAIEHREADDGAMRLVGYAAVYDSWSGNLGGFREKIAPGAFKSAIERGDDVRALLNHDANYILGRTKSGTLKLEEDSKGLRIDVTLPDTQIARDLVWAPIQRGDIDQMSFGFQVIADEWNADRKERTLKDVRLFDVSPVTYPAYEATEVYARGAIHAEIERLTKLVEGLTGRTVTPAATEEEADQTAHAARLLRALEHATRI